MVNLYYGNKEVRVESVGFCAIDIRFEGKPFARINDKFNYRKGQSRLLIWADHPNIHTNETLLTYSGDLRIINAMSADWDLNVETAKINVENVHTWN